MNPQTMFIVGQDGNPVMINTVDFDPETMTAHGVDDGKEHEPVAPSSDPVNPPDAGQPVAAVEPVAPAPIAPPVEPVAAVEPVAPAPIAPPVEPVAPAPIELMYVAKRGRKFFVTDKDGKDVEAEGIDADGYGAEDKAWAAITARNTRNTG